MTKGNKIVSQNLVRAMNHFKGLCKII